MEKDIDFKELLDDRFDNLTKRRLSELDISKRTRNAIGRGMYGYIKGAMNETRLIDVIIVISKIGRDCFYGETRGIGPKAIEEFERYLLLETKLHNKN